MYMDVFIKYISNYLNKIDSLKNLSQYNPYQNNIIHRTKKKKP
jgi:hypothetical protein